LDRPRSVKDDFTAFHAAFDSTQHTMSAHVVRVDGDRASSFCNGGRRLLRQSAGDPLWDGTGLTTSVLRREADAGRVGILGALAG
jgi:SnoaL-like domain